MSQRLIYAHSRDQHAVTCPENVLQLNKGQGKELGFQLSHRQPLECAKVSVIFTTLYKVSTSFRIESFINATKVLNFTQSLANEKKVLKVSNGVPYFWTSRLFSGLHKAS